jgi:hypothetical protein
MRLLTISQINRGHGCSCSLSLRSTDRIAEFILGDDTVLVGLEPGKPGDGFGLAGAARAGLVGDILVFKNQAAARIITARLTMPSPPCLPGLTPSTSDVTASRP